jgi:deoxyribonuclease V
VKVYEQHGWNLDYHDATLIQIKLQRSVRSRPLSLKHVRLVAGADIAISKSRQLLVSAVAVYAFPTLELVETRTAVTDLAFPYIPGLLSFREIPALVVCLKRVVSKVDVVICDGHGIAHPRGLGLASHLGVLLRRPTIGCAKKLLVGEFEQPGRKRGSYSPLSYRGKRVGSVLRTRDNVKPVFVSPGHLTDQSGCRRLVLACATRYRLPEPTRCADRLAGEERRRLESAGLL